MAFTSYILSDTTLPVIALSSHVTTSPAYLYKDGERTDEPRTNAAGKPLYRLHGVCPIVQGEGVPQVSVFVDKEIDLKIQPGSFVQVTGEFKIRSGGQFGLAGTIEGTLSAAEKKAGA